MITNLVKLNNLIVMITFSCAFFINTGCSNQKANEYSTEFIDSIVNCKVDSILNCKQEHLGPALGLYDIIHEDTIRKYIQTDSFLNRDAYIINYMNKLHVGTNMMIGSLYDSLCHLGYRMYFKKGKLLHEDYHREGNIDSFSLWYSKDNKLTQKGFYRNGKKNGVFLSFYENGNVKSEAFYKDDKLIDNKIEYYPNRKIKAIGNDYSGIFKEYYPNGKIRKETVYRKGKAIELKRFYNKISKNSERKTLKNDSIISLDSLLYNQTDIKVELLFFSDRNNKDSTWLKSWDKLYLQPQLSVNDELSVHFGTRIFIINEKEIQVCDSCIDLNNSKKVSYNYFGAKPYIYPSNPKHKNWKKIETFKKNVGTVYVTTKSAGCYDTGNHEISVFRKAKWLRFYNSGNLFFFEYDVDQDGFGELYLFSYESCKGVMRIYKLFF